MNYNLLVNDLIHPRILFFCSCGNGKQCNLHCCAGSYETASPKAEKRSNITMATRLTPLSIVQ